MPADLLQLPPTDGGVCAPSVRGHGDQLPGLPVLHHYVVVRADLPPGLQAAQVIHAAGESALLTASLPPGTHAVALHADGEAALVALGRALDGAGFACAKIYENDPPYAGQLMALGVAPLERTSKLKRLLGRCQTIK